VAELSLPHLRYFWAVAREGNLTRAAGRLNVSQSAVSVQIRKLEDALGTVLFERRGRGLELTNAGRVALDYADRIFSLGDELLHALESEGRRAERTVRVGVLATLSRNFQIGFLSPLVNRPGTRLRLRSGTVADLLQRLEGHDLDVVLSNYAPARHEDANWVVHTIDEQPVSLIGQPDLDLSRFGLAELVTQHPLVVPPVESGIRVGLDALFERLGVRPNVVAEIDDMATLRVVARMHEGLTVIPPIVVQDELASGTLVEHRQLPSLVESFLAITAPRRLRNPILDELLPVSQPVQR